MNLVFDFDFDSGAWPGPLAERDAVAGEAWVGPAGLLGMLETALGLGGHYPSFSERAAAMVKRCREQQGFWSASAAVDPLATARRLLQWRDQLWLEGWRDEAVAPRLKELAAVSAGLSPGVPDRLAAVASALASRSPGFESLRLFTTEASLPRLWREVLGSLAKHGCRVSHVEPDPAAARGDLAASRVAKFAPTGDGSLQLIRSRGPLEAAEQIAAWIAARRADGEAGSTVLIAPDAVLDRALRRHGLPTVGGPMSAQDDALLQIVPLVLALGWTPPDPQRALELLTLPAGPVRSVVARRLVRALHQWPAVDSDAWRKALDEGLAALEDEEERETLKERLAVLLRPSVPGATYPIGEVRRRLEVVGRWLQGRMAIDEQSTRWARAYGQCSGLERLLNESGLDAFTAPQLKRFIEEATGRGAGDAPFDHEAGISSVASPGAICGPATTIVWWGFDRSSAARPRALPFSSSELKALGAIGVALPSAGAEAMQASARWSRPLHQAAETLLLVCPQRGDDGDELFPHPLFDEIGARVADTARLSSLVRSEPLGVEARKKKRELHPLPVPVRTIEVPPGAIAKRERESPSGAGTLLGCSVKWVLDYVGWVRGGASARLPEAENLLGSTAHEILARLLRGPKLKPDEAHQQACELFETEGPRLAAVLFQPGAEAEKARAKRATAEAARALFGLLHRSNMEVLEVETERSGSAFGTELVGTPDVLVGRSRAEPRIIDLKWGGARYRRDSLAEGTSYQLATYSQLTREGKGRFPPTAYFIVGTQALYSTDADAFPGAQQVDGPNPQEIWQAFEAAYAVRWTEVEKGHLEAPANPNEAGELGPGKDSLIEGALQLAAPCRFCDFAGLCGRAFAPEVAASEGGAA